MWTTPNIKNKDSHGLLRISIANDSPNVTIVLLNAGLPITSESLKVVASRFERGEVIIGLLLERDTAFEIIEAVIEKVFTKQIIAERFDKDVMTLLLYGRGSTITITDEIVRAAVGNARCSLEVMKLLLEKRGSQFNISQEVIMATARNSSSGTAVLGLLLGKRRQEIEITEEVIETAEAHWDSHGIRLLLKELRRPFKITQTVLKKAARNEVDSTNVIKLFLGNGGNKLKISEEVMVAAVKNFECGIELIDMLLKEYSGHFKIIEALVEAVAGSWDRDKKMRMLLEKAGNELLLDERPGEIKITDEVLVTAAENEEHLEQMMELLLREESWDAEKLIMLLFKKWGNSLSITEKVLETAAANENSEKILILLLKKGAENFEVDIKVTEGILQAAAENEIYGLEVMKFLLTHCPTQSSITEEVLKAAAANEKLGKELIELLLEHGIVVFSDAVVATAAAHGQEDVLQTLGD
ncbi:hypothetical protein G7Y89_g11920 [Cudoniella acicularis]|uniref:Uncharacterized protein n=1 Tax=Cudoniella acicularis TaxID=354080 RepID=A0A8H4R9X8_9HELO|nr:hypothetical protein G7Y89_g11920 [Cudoniella acicularis]